MKKSFDNSLRYRLKIILAYRDLLRNHCKPVFEWYAKRFRNDQKKAALRLKDKEKIDVAFMLTIPGMWKSDYLFKALECNPKYHPYVVIYPYSFYKGFSKKEVDDTLRRTEAFIKDKGFEYVIPYDKKKGRWQNVRKTLHPDIVVFTTPYKDFPPQYFVYNFRRTLTIYVPYGFTSLNMYHVNYDLIFHNLVGMHFVETDIHKKMATEHSRNHGANIYVSGYPGTEVFLRPDYIPRNVWKSQDRVKKRVIWAPHHTIDNSLSISTFLTCCDIMPKLAKKYEDQIQMVFKPHPLLKFKLQKIWGEEKVTQYYSMWDEMKNTQLEESSYVDLFLTSDAMIHDCGSFTTEYMFTRKPVMYLLKNTDFLDKFCEFGLLSFANHYHGRKEEDIDRFLREVVLEGKDEMKEQREQFYEDYLAPKDGLMPSEKIIELIEGAIRG